MAMMAMMAMMAIMAIMGSSCVKALGYGLDGSGSMSEGSTDFSSLLMSRLSWDPLSIP